MKLKKYLEIIKLELIKFIKKYYYANYLEEEEIYNHFFKDDHDNENDCEIYKK